VAVSRLRSIILLAAGLVAIASSVILLFFELSSPTHTAVSPENDPLAIRLAFLAGLGWTLIGGVIGSQVGARTRSSLIIAMAVTGALLGGLMGFLAWIGIHFMLTS
jgi:hypothetical protein